MSECEHKNRRVAGCSTTAVTLYCPDCRAMWVKRLADNQTKTVQIAAGGDGSLYALTESGDIYLGTMTGGESYWQKLSPIKDDK
jgi:hypothetical protein